MEEERWQPVPVPLGDGRHDIGDDVRAAIVERLQSDWSRDPDLTPEKVRQLAMWAGASVRALLHELGTLHDLAEPSGDPPPAPCVHCGHHELHNGPAGDIADACTHEVCNCGFYSRGDTADPLVNRHVTEVQPGLYVSQQSGSVFAPPRRARIPPPPVMGAKTIIDLLVLGGAVKSAAHRAVATGSVSVNGVRVTSPTESIPPSGVLKVGQSRIFVFHTSLGKDSLGEVFMSAIPKPDPNSKDDWERLCAKQSAGPPVDRQGPPDVFTALDTPVSIADALERVRTLVKSEAGHIAYLDDSLDDLVGAARAFGHGEGQEHAIADVNASRVDDMIQPRLQAAPPALTALVARWEAAADTANALVAKYQVQDDDAGNAHAFLKERQIWRTCAAELRKWLEAK